MASINKIRIFIYKSPLTSDGLGVTVVEITDGCKVELLDPGWGINGWDNGI